MSISAQQYTIVSGPDDVPIKMSSGPTEPEQWEDLRNSHEEADTIIIYHMVESVRNCGAKSIHIKSSDTDVFVLLCHFTWALNLNADIFMIPLSQKTKPIDICQTVIQNQAVMPHLLSMHGISG